MESIMMMMMLDYDERSNGGGGGDGSSSSSKLLRTNTTTNVTITTTTSTSDSILYSVNSDVSGLRISTDFPVYALTTSGGSDGEEDELAYLGFGIPNTVFTRRLIHYCFGTLLILFGVAGLLGNGLVLYVFARYRRLRGGGGPLILSLASGDCMVSLLHFMPAYSSFKEEWAFGDLGCEIYAASVGLGGLASLITLSVIAADRFSVIMGHPVQWISGKKACAAIWITSFLLVFPPFIGWSRFVREGLNTSCSWDYATRTLNNRSYYIYLLLFGFVLPVGAVIVSYVGILIVICRHSNKMNGVTRNGIIHSKKRPTKSDLRTAQVILTVIICFLVSWTPYALVSLYYQFGTGTPSLSPLAVALPAIFAKASVVYNPIVYGLSHPHFRSAVRMLKARHLGGRNADRYHYQCSPAGFRGKTPLIVTRSRCHNDLKRLQDIGSISRQGPEQTTDAQTTMKTMDFSRNSYDEVMRNRRGWVFLRMRSGDQDSGQTFGTSLVHDKGISSVMDSTSYSEPDRLDNGGEIVKMSTCYNVCEYRRRKTFLKRSFFHSENCLTHLLRITDPHSCSTPDTSQASTRKTRVIMCLNSDGSATSCVTTAKKSEFLSSIGPSNLVNSNNNNRPSEKESHPPGTSHASSNSRPYIFPPDPTINTSKALRLTLSKSDESFPRRAFWFLRHRGGGKGYVGCHLKRTKCIRRKRKFPVHYKRPSAPSWLTDMRSSIASLSGGGRENSACVECSCRFTAAATMMTQHNCRSSSPVITSQDNSYSEWAPQIRVCENGCPGYSTDKVELAKSNKHLPNIRSPKFQSKLELNWCAQSSAHLVNRVGESKQTSDKITSKDKWKHATLTVVNLIKSGKPVIKSCSCRSCKQLPHIMATLSADNAESFHYLNHHGDLRHRNHHNLSTGGACCLETSMILTSRSEIHQGDSGCSCYQDSVYSDGGSDTFYSCN